jgi:pentatricopeptide repeat protein
MKIKMAFKCLLFGLTLAGAVSAMSGFSQSRQKPRLIRDTEKAEEESETADVETPKDQNPQLAAQNLKVGDFYFKKKNYAAAIQRYLDAIAYLPTFTDAYQALVRAYEKNGDLSKAIKVCRDFISKNPDSPKVPEFQTILSKLEKL